MAPWNTSFYLINARESRITLGNLLSEYYIVQMIKNQVNFITLEQYLQNLQPAK
jgi:hypothetical protein